MRTRNVRTLAAVIAPCLALSMLAAPSQAVQIASEDFEDYLAGSLLHGLNGGTGFTGSWNVAAARQPEVPVVNSPLSYSRGTVMVDGGQNAGFWAATQTSTEVLAGRDLPTLPDVVYMSMLYQQFGSSGDNDHMQFGFDTSSTANPRASIVDRDNGEFQVRPTTGAGSSVGSGQASIDGETHLLVMRAAKTGGSSTYNNLRLFVNPSSPDELANGFVEATANTGLDGADAFIIRKAFQEAGLDSYFFDEIKIGTAFNDVVPLSTSPVMQVVTTATGFGADAFVRSGGQSGNNFGSDPSIHIKTTTSGTGDFNRKGWLRFDISGLPPAPTGTAGIETVELSLVVEGFSPLGATAADIDWDFNIFGLDDSNADVLWDEGSINWDNAPGNDTGSAGGVNPAETTFLGQFTLTGFGEAGALATLTGQELIDFLEADTNGMLTFIITRDTVEFGSNSVVHELITKEGSGAPFLKITYDEIPEPASAMLLGLGGLALLRRRRAA